MEKTNLKEQQELRKKLIKRLQDDMCMFKYKKKSTGEERIALGTLNPDNYEYEFEGGEAWYNAWYLTRYWDINKNAWRCFDFRNIIEIYW